MDNSKTLIFEGNEGGNGMLGLVSALCQRQGLDPNMVMAMMNNRNGFGSEGGWFWIILFLIFGWGGFGGNGFGGRNGQGLADLGNLVNNDAGRELLMQAITGNGAAIGQLATTLNCDINALQGTLNTIQQSLCALGNQVGMGTQSIINAINSGNCSLATQLSSCCCDIREAITRQGYEGQLRTLEQTSSIKADSDSKFNVLSAKIDAQTQIINDKFCALEMREMAAKIASLQQENSQLALAASQQAQTANIVNQLRPCPTPAYVVPNPFGCGCNNFGYPYGYNGYNGGCGNGCGC